MLPAVSVVDSSFWIQVLRDWSWSTYFVGAGFAFLVCFLFMACLRNVLYDAMYFLIAVLLPVVFIVVAWAIGRCFM